MNKWVKPIGLTILIGIAVAVASFFFPWIIISPVMIFLSPGLDTIAGTIFIFGAIALLIWAWKSAVRKRQELKISDPLNEVSGKPITSRSKKIILVISLVVYAAVATFIWMLLYVKCCVPSDDIGFGLGAFIIIVLAPIVAFVVGLFIIFVVRTWKSMWLTAVVLAGIYTLLTVGTSGFQLIQKNLKLLQFRQEAKKSQSYTTMTQCASIIEKAYGQYPDYTSWRDCAYRSLKTEEDYQTCKSQAGNKYDAYNHQHLQQYCEEGQKLTQSKTINDCTSLGSEAQETCIDQFVTDRATFVQCVQALENIDFDPFSGKIFHAYNSAACFMTYVAISHDPKVCDILFRNAGVTSEQQSICNKESGWTVGGAVQ